MLRQVYLLPNLQKNGHYIACNLRYSTSPILDQRKIYPEIYSNKQQGKNLKTSIFNTMVEMASPPPPPPPTSKKSRKTMIAVIAVVIIAVLIVVVYLAAQGLGTNNSVTPTPTPVPGTTATPAPSTSPTSSGTGSDIAEASSLKFTVTMTDSSGATTASYTYSAKNAGTSNMMMRVEFTDPDSSSNFIYIVNGALRQAWMSSNGEWIDLSSAYDSQYSDWNETFSDYKNNLSDWTGLGDWSYTVGGETIRIHNIKVNPSLPDSMFEHS